MHKILLIEDDSTILEDIATILTVEGYAVTAVTTGEDGLRCAAEWQPDLVVCDIGLPHMDGYDVLAAVRAHEAMAMLPFIFLTGRSERPSVRQGMAAGADDYLIKPVQPLELLNSIRMQLHKADLRSTITDLRLRELSDNITTAIPHEMRTPLNTITGYSDMLISQAHSLTSEQIIDWAQNIREAGQRLYELVEHQILYVRLQVIAHSPEKREHYAQARLQDTHELAEMLAMQMADKARRLPDLRFDLAKSPPVCCTYADLVILLREILDNAFKFAPPPPSRHRQRTASAALLYPDDHRRGARHERRPDRPHPSLHAV